jgi:hypothetical protein
VLSLQYICSTDSTVKPCLYVTDLRIPANMPKMPVKTKSSQYSGSQQSHENTSTIPPAIRLKYQVGKVIGDGNFAVVRQCIDR